MGHAGKVRDAQVMVRTTVKVNTEQGLAICLIIEAGGHSAWEGWQAAAAPPSLSLYLTENDTDRVCSTDKGKKHKRIG